MKKFITLILSALLSLSVFAFAGCGNKNDEFTIKVGASATPHAQILEQVKQPLKEQGYNLIITIYDDYKIPNVVLSEGELDANYFQHAPFMEDFNKSNKGTKLVSAAAIHYEPFGIFGNNVSDIASVPQGAKIFIPSDSSNGTRALFLLQEQNLIKLKDGVTSDDILSNLDIVDNKGYEVVSFPAEQIPTQLSSNKGSLAVLNGNYAMQHNLKIQDAIALEDDKGEFPQMYANVIAVRQGEENSAKITALVNAIKTQAMKDYMATTFNGAVRPIFEVK